jgi:adenylate kinase family enzyme
MAVKLFVLGLPGSGKSTVARHISNYAREIQWSATHINDFAILYKMFKEDTQGQFKRAAYGGFDVLDLTVFDTALRKLEQKVKECISTIILEEIVLIEFSRNDYEKAFKQFSQEFLQDAYFLYLSVDLDTCKRRIHARITKQTTVDDHYVSDYIFKAYYSGDNGRYLPQMLERDYGIDKQKVMIIDNSGLPEDYAALINQFVDTVIMIEAQFLRETEPMRRITDFVQDGELKHQ